MGQTVSGGNISSIFTWPSNNTRVQSDDCRECDTADALKLNEDSDSRQQKNYKTLSCFRTQDAVDEACEDNHGNMPSSKKCYNFCNEEHEDDNSDCCHINHAHNSNHSCVKHYDTARSAPTDEINGNQVESVQSCSFENSNRNATSINRYVSAFTERVDKISLKDDANKEASGFKAFTVKSKRKKPNLRECNSCAKESKNNNKSGTKKKNNWMRFGSKLGKVNNTKASSNDTCSATPDSDSTCICTSYKKMDDGAKQEGDIPAPEPPIIRHNLTLGWACERVNMNRNSSPSWGVFSGGSNVYNQQQQQNRECISCEGSHCHMDLNTLAELSNIGRLPINITVTRVATQRSYAVPGSAEGNVILLSLATQNPPVIDLRRLNPEEHLVEDCEERARVRRALEIAEGVEPPPGYNSPQIQVVSPGELRALLFQQQMPSAALLTTQPIPQRARIHTQVDYIHCLVPDLRSITGCSFYWGKMDRYEAERLLDGKPEGTFLLRDSAQEEYLFSVSFRKYQRSLHARIEQFNHKFSFDSHDPGVFASDTVTGLIEHYKDPTCVMFFEPMLTAPLSRTFTFPLQHLCRAVIVSCTTYDGINELRLPPGIKAYLKEYHYRQRVRVKRFDESPESSEESQ